MNSQILYAAREKLISEIEKSILNYIQDEHAKRFYLWSFSSQNPHRERWLHLIGITQLVQLTFKMLDGLAEGAQLERLLDYSLPMNVYQFYEIISDNLSIGLGSPIPDDPHAGSRKAVLLAFNEAMVARLRGSPRPASELLAPVHAAARSIPTVRQTLGAEVYTAVAAQYVAQTADVTLSDINSAIWSLLVANIETCQDLSRSFSSFRIGPLLTDGLISRYEAVSALVTHPDMCLLKRVMVSGDAILVVPTLAYYVGVLAEAQGPLPNITDLISEGVLGEALFTAALLLRMLNDLGTLLLVDDKTRTDLLQSLHAALQSGFSSSFAELLRTQIEHCGAPLTRLHKDLHHGEINLCLFSILDLPAKNAVPRFEQRLQVLADLYARSQTYLSQLTRELTTRLGDDRPSRLVHRFVRFHEELYRNAYTEQSGEYTG